MSSSTTLVALIAVLVLCVGVSAAQLVRSSPSNADRVHDFTVFADQTGASWTAFGREWMVNLELSGVVEDNTDYFIGSLQGDVGAVVSFSLLPGTGLSGMIITQGSTWWISAQPLPETGYSLEDDRLGVFMTRESHSELDAASIPSFSEPLHSEDEDQHDDALDVDTAAQVAEEELDAEGVAVPRRKRGVSSFKVAVFYDQKWALASNNPWASQANTISLLNDVNAIYHAAGLANFTVVYQKQVASTDATSTLNSMLSYFSDTASRSLSSFSDTSFTNHLWLVGSNVGGLAYVGTSCKPTGNVYRKTGVAGLVSYSRLWTVKTIAHELGHNRGANHQFVDACTASLKSGCQCSVMSCCFPQAGNNPKGAVNFFSDFSINEMNNAGCN